MSAHLSRAAAEATAPPTSVSNAQEGQNSLLDRIHGDDIAYEDDDPQPHLDSLREAIQATLQIGSASALMSHHTREALGILGGSSASSSEVLAPSVSPLTASPVTAGAMALREAHRASSKYTMAMLEKSVEDLIFSSTPPPPSYTLPARPSVVTESARIAHTVSTATATATAEHTTRDSSRPPQGPVTGPWSSDALLFHSSSSVMAHKVSSQPPPPVPSPPLPSGAKAGVGTAGEREKGSRPPILGALPPPSPFATPSSTMPPPPPRRGLQSTSVQPSHKHIETRVTDESTATMDHAVRIPASLRGAGRRTMLDVLQQQRDMSSPTSLEADEGLKGKRVDTNARSTTKAESRSKDGVVHDARVRHATAVQALLFPQGIAVIEASSGPQPSASHTVPPKGEEHREDDVQPDLRRSLRHFLPSVRAKAAAQVQRDADAHRAQQYRTQADLASAISDFSDSDDDDEGGVRAAPLSLSSATTPHAPAAGSSAASNFLAHVIGSPDATEGRGQPRTQSVQERHAAAPVRRPPCTTISELLRGEDDGEAVAGAGGATRGVAHEAVGVPVDALLHWDTGDDADTPELRAPRVAPHTARGSVLGLLAEEEMKDDEQRRPHARPTASHPRQRGGQRVRTPHRISTLADQELPCDSASADRSPSSRSSSPSGSRGSSCAKSQTSISSEGNARVYLDALVDLAEDDDTEHNAAVTHHGEGRSTSTRVESIWRSVCRELNTRLNAFFVGNDAPHTLRSEEEQHSISATPTRLVDTHTWWSADGVSDAMRWATRAFVLNKTSLGCAFAKPPSLTMASLLSSTTGTAGRGAGQGGPPAASGGLGVGLGANRSFWNGAGGGGAGVALMHPAQTLLNGTVRPPPFVSHFLAAVSTGVTRGVTTGVDGMRAVEGTSRWSQQPAASAQLPAHSFNGAGNDANEEGEDDDWEEREVRGRAPVHQAASTSLNISAVSMVYRIFELFQAVLLGRVGVYTVSRSATHVGTSTPETRAAGVEADGNACGAPQTHEVHGSATTGSARVEHELPHPAAPAHLVGDVMAWGEQVQLAVADVSRANARKPQPTGRHGTVTATNANIFTAAVRAEQLPSRRLRRRLAENPVATRVLAFSKDAFNQWRCGPKRRRAIADKAMVSPSAASQSAARDAEEVVLDGLDVHFCARSVDSAYGLVRVKGDLCFVDATVRSLFWSADAARAYSDQQVRTLLAQSQGRGWTLLLPASVAEAVPIHLDTFVYVARPFVVVSAERLIMTSYTVTSQALLTRSTLALDHLIATALALNDRPRRTTGDRQRPSGSEVSGRLKRSRRSQSQPPLSAASSARSSRSPSVQRRSPHPESSTTTAVTAAVLVVRGARSQTTTPQRTARAAYMLSPLAPAAAPTLRGVSESTARPRKYPLYERFDGAMTRNISGRPDEDDERDTSPLRQPSTTPMRSGFYDPLALGGLMGGAGAGSGSGNGSHDSSTIGDGIRSGLPLRRGLQYGENEDEEGEEGAEADEELRTGVHARISQEGRSNQRGKALISSASSTSQALAYPWPPSSSTYASQQAAHSAWAAVDPLGASFPRGPDALWDVPLEVLLALARFTLSPTHAPQLPSPPHTHGGVRGAVPIELEDDEEEVLEEVSFSLHVAARGDGVGVSSRFPNRDMTSDSFVPTPTQAQMPTAASSGVTGSLCSVTTATPGRRASGAPASSIASLFPDVYLDSQSS